MLDHRALTFLTVCEEMNYTKAAERLHMTQPAISQQIQYLETYYQVKLFSFQGKKMSLTDAGKLLEQSLRYLHNNEIYLKKQLTHLSNKKETLHFGSTLTVGEFLIAKPLTAFLKEHKGADVSVTVANTKHLLELLDHGQIDFAILEGEYPRNLYAHVPFLTENFIPICGKDYAFTKQPEVINDLLEECLFLREPGSGTRFILEQALLDHQLSFQSFSNIITIGNMHAIKEMVQENCGITFLYESAVKEDLKQGTIRRIPLKDFSLQHEISLVWKKDNLFEDAYTSLFRELFHIDCAKTSS